MKLGRRDLASLGALGVAGLWRFLDVFQIRHCHLQGSIHEIR